MAVWHIGDFGRFSIENPNYPRFEVVSADKEKKVVTIWYSGEEHPQTIPAETFVRDCVNWWKITDLQQESPHWLVPGKIFALNSPSRAINVIITQIMEKHRSTTRGVDVNGRAVSYRRRQGDYVSVVSVDPPKFLLLIPLKTVIEFGHPVQTRWDLLRTINVINGEEELF